ncbi:MAG: phosphatase PAP2 family protein [Bacteroidota bacterium]
MESYEEKSFVQETEKRKRNYPAIIVSYLFHPLVMPVAGIFVLFNSGTSMTLVNPNIKLYIYLITFITTFCFPLLIIPFFVHFNLVRNLKMESIEERRFPMAVTAIFFFFAYYYLNQDFIPHGYISSFLLGAFISVLLVFFITLKWKISAHMAGIGGVLGLLFALTMLAFVDMQFYLVIAFAISGLLGYARMAMNAHTPLQVFAGYMLGFLAVFVSMIIGS